MNEKFDSMDKHTSNVQVLLIDNDASHQEIISNYLNDFDITLFCVHTVLEAMNEIKQGNYPLIFVHLDFPQLDGYEITLSIRNTLQCNLPVVGFSNLQIDTIKSRYFDAGMNAIISKPIDRIELGAMITQFLPNMLKSIPVESKYKGNFSVIDLTYLKDISLGDATFEREITEKFLMLIDENLETMKQNLSLGLISELRKTAHFTRSTIFIMGLNSVLEKPLKMIEHGNLSQNELALILKEVEDVIKIAKADANKFLE